MHALIWLASGLVVGWLARRLAARESEKPGEVVTVGDLESHAHRLGQFERRLFERLLHHRERPLRDPNAAFDEQLSFGQRMADQVASWGGSWTFIGVFLLLMAIWITVNSETRDRFDPFPFILLNLLLSCLAALQAPVIMMSQNRQTAKDRMDAHSDYEVNLRAELEIQKLHAKLDEQQASDWIGLLEIQRRQLDLLERIARRLDAREA